MNDEVRFDSARLGELLGRPEGLYRAIADLLDYGVWVCDAAGRCVHVSESFLRLTGLTQEECASEGWGRVLHPDERDETLAAWQACVRGGGAWDREHRILGRDGKFHPVLARGVPVRDGEGRILYWAGINLDISRLKGAEEKYRESSRRKDEFLATLAHELRNPLAPIRNAARSIRLKAADDPQLQRAQEIIDRQVDHLSRLVDDLLDISRITHDKIELRLERVPLQTVVEYAVELTRPQIEARRHVFSFDPGVETVWVLGDSARLSQSVANLLSNATKFTEPGGRIEARILREGSDVIVRVRDSGIGMAPDMVERVFDLFMQADRSLDRSQGGLGLGLTLVKRLVELHEGRVEARSDGPGQGSEFDIRLPVAEPPAAGLVPSPRAEPALAPRRVLVVDDNRDAADTTAELLRYQRHNVQAVYSGAAALGVARVFKPEVVFLDIGLPGMDGYEIARRLRQFPETAGSRLIAVTGYGQARDRERSRAAGFDDHLVKPVDPDALQALIAAHEPERARTAS